MAAKKTSSAREKFASAGDEYSTLLDQRRQRLREDMSENLERIGVFLPHMMTDEAAQRTRGNSLDEGKLQERYFGGFPLERIGFMRIGVNVFQFGLSPYCKEDVEGMTGFRTLVKSCAAPEVDMNIRLVYDPSWACLTAEVRMDVPFDRNGPYKDIAAPASAPNAAPAKPKMR